MIRIFLFMAYVICLLGCGKKMQVIQEEPVPPPFEDISEVHPATATPKKVELRRSDSLHLLLSTNPILSKHFVGLHIYDIKSEEEVFAYNARQHFTPASNMKLFTLLSCLEILDDEIATLAYCKSGTDLIIKGCGDPSFMTQTYSGDDIIKMVQRTKGRIYIDESHFLDKRFGSGWAWDDYPYYYQKEKTPLPVYGNGLLIDIMDSINITTYPTFGRDLVSIDTSETRMLSRPENSNQIKYNPTKNKRKKVYADIPFRMDETFTRSLLSKALGKPVYACPPSKECKTYREVKHKIGDLYKRMILDSDNFIADQLLLSCSYELFDTMDTRRVIKHLIQDQFAELSDTVRWVDGSGLSRYNLVTPRSITQILEKILEKKSWTFVKNIFPSKNSKGTLTQEFNVPNVYAKTGSLSNNYNLSGYIKSKSGRIYAFSFMNNHFMDRTTEVNGSMQDILAFIYRRF